MKSIILGAKSGTGEGEGGALLQVFYTEFLLSFQISFAHEAFSVFPFSPETFDDSANFAAPNIQNK